MYELVRFLEVSYVNSLNWKNMQEIHIVLGNEAGDLDSVMSTIGYAHFLHSTTNRLVDDPTAIFPVLNFDREGMEARLEHKYLFEQSKIDLDKLIYRNQLNFEEMIEECQKSGKTLNTYLVDHHKLNENDKNLKKTVCRIFDHRPLDKYFSWTDFNLKMRLEPVASCCTLIAQELFVEEGYVIDPALAYLMFCAIVYDMKGRNNPGTLDEEMKTYLWSKTSHRPDPKKTYAILEKLHCECDHLTPLQILTRDLKSENGVLFPRLSMLAEDFIKLEGAHSAIEALCHQHQSNLAVLIGTKRSLEGQSVDVGVFFRNFESKFVEKFEKELKAARFAALRCEYENFIIYKYFGKRIGRKKMLPLILEIREKIKER